MRNVIVVVALSLSVLAACAVRMIEDTYKSKLTTEPIYLRHQKTGQIVQCGPDYGDVEASTIQMRELFCINDYRLQGFVRIPTPEGKP